MSKYIIGLTGASGAIYGVRLIKALLERGHQTLITITDAGRRVLREEVGWNLAGAAWEIEASLKNYFGIDETSELIRYFDNNDVGALIASGSVKTDGMIIVPCTMSAVSAIARGASTDLLERAADVILKEKRTLVVVPRETPLSQVHLHNLLMLAQMGVHVMPAMPAFYYKPQSLDDIIDFMVGRVLDFLGVEHSLYKRWQG
nr:flavin prenyltransferase UbiX [Zhaonella formicivorans]